MNSFFAGKKKKKPTLFANIITNLNCNCNIYLFIAYFCSTFACGQASASRE